jgi:hypothetical protein
MRTRQWTTLLALAGLAACGGDFEPPQISIVGVVSSITVDGEPANVTLERGTPPPENAAPVIDATVPVAAINGGSFTVNVTSADQFSEVVIGMPGTPDYYRIVLASPRTSAMVVVTLDPGTPGGPLELFVAGGTAPTAFGPYVSRTLSITRVGSGDVQVSVAWNSAADVDLHVIDPAGEEIFWGARASLSGGELDLDSNAACTSDQPRNENTVWPRNGAPAGAFTVRLDYWDDCDAVQTDYVVTIWVRGQEAQVFSGTFTGAGDQGGEGSGIDIATFTR